MKNKEEDGKEKNIKSHKIKALKNATQPLKL